MDAFNQCCVIKLFLETYELLTYNITSCSHIKLHTKKLYDTVHRYWTVFFWQVLQMGLVLLTCEKVVTFMAQFTITHILYSHKSWVM